jgi:hypothetical protein
LQENGTGLAVQGVSLAASKQAAAEDAADRDAEPAQAPALCMLLGSNQDGKTSLVNMLLSISMDTPEDYAQHIHEQYRGSSGALDRAKLEATARLR